MVNRIIMFPLVYNLLSRTQGIDTMLYVEVRRMSAEMPFC